MTFDIVNKIRLDSSSNKLHFFFHINYSPSFKGTKKMLMSTTRQNNALEKKNIRESKIIKISLSLTHHHHHHCISQIILKEGDEKLRTQQPKKKIQKKISIAVSVCTQRWLWESSVYTALRVFTLIEQNEANEEQQQQNKKKFNASVGICFRVCVQTKRKNKKKIHCCCLLL